MRVWILASLLLVAAALIVVGVASLSGSVALIVAGLLTGGWAWLVFGEVGG